MSKVKNQLLGQQQYRHLNMDGLRPQKLKPQARMRASSLHKPALMQTG
jgi:hypothetical protein